MADVDKILRLVSEGVLTADEADEILSGREEATEQVMEPANSGARHLRIEVMENGKKVVNLRVPMSVAGWASAFLPGLSDDQADRIRGAMASGERGPLLDINDSDGSRVLIVSE